MDTVLIRFSWALILAPALFAAVPSSAAVAAAPASQLLALDRPIAARAAPSADSAAVAHIAAYTPLTAARTVVPVIQTKGGPNGGTWLQVRLPGRPNGSTGWVPADAGALRTTAWRIVVHRSVRSASVFEGNTLRARYRIVVGKRSTPTPLGTFFVTEKLHLAPGVVEGPWALATSAYSNVLQQFGGGPGQIALHGTVGLSAPLGTFSSHGCIRFGVAAITWIAKHIPDGTSVVVLR